MRTVNSVTLTIYFYLFSGSSDLIGAFEPNFQDNLFPIQVFMLQNLNFYTTLSLFYHFRLFPVLSSPFIASSFISGYFPCFIYSFYPFRLFLFFPGLFYPLKFISGSYYRLWSFLLPLLLFFILYLLPDPLFRLVFPAALVSREKFNIDSFYQ